MSRTGHHRAVQFERHGSLAYRFALAMLGSQEAAEQAVAAVFASLDPDEDGPDFRILERLRIWCLARAPSIQRPEPVQPENDTSLEAIADQLLIPTDTVATAFFGMMESDQSALWRALVEGSGEESELAAAMRRLDIAIQNEGIPGGGDEWPT